MATSDIKVSDAPLKSNTRVPGSLLPTPALSEQLAMFKLRPQVHRPLLHRISFRASGQIMYATIG